MKSLISMMAGFLLLTMVSGCKELDKLAELDEMAGLLENIQLSPFGDSLRIDSALVLTDVVDTPLYDSVTVDSVPENTMLTVIKKVRLEGHEYWTIVGVGERMGGAGITHSESCWCNRFRNTGTGMRWY